MIAPEASDDGATVLESAPLAARMRPRTFDEYVGQEHIVGEGKILRRLSASDSLPSMILWGPPGTGKTTLARLLAASSNAAFTAVSAVAAGVADLRRVTAEARDRLRASGQRTVLFIDEIHRFNKAQQDAILPFVEDGTITLIGATTENPSFEVIGPLLSRSRVFALKQLEPESIAAIIRRALVDKERGLGGSGASVDDDAIEALANSVGGDARIALNALEAAVQAAQGTVPGARVAESGASARVTKEDIEEALQHRTYLYDRQGDAHYDTISAFIKSVRGSDPDAALYWLARMIESGEDPLFIVRRMVILASEDVGLADPMAMVIATSCQQAVHFIGLPEGFFPMAETALYLALAPKSNTVGRAYGAAMSDVQATRNDPVPLHLRNAVTGLMRQMGYGKGYKYAHDYEGGVVEQQHRPEHAEGHTYYRPGKLGWEARRAAEWAERRGAGADSKERTLNNKRKARDDGGIPKSGS
jgi:putative ATPase